MRRSVGVGIGWVRVRGCGLFRVILGCRLGLFIFRGIILGVSIGLIFLSYMGRGTLR